jgi:hypothetical protein
MPPRPDPGPPQPQPPIDPPEPQPPAPAITAVAQRKLFAIAS